MSEKLLKVNDNKNRLFGKAMAGIGLVACAFAVGGYVIDKQDANRAAALGPITDNGGHVNGIKFSSEHPIPGFPPRSQLFGVGAVNSTITMSNVRPSEFISADPPIKPNKNILVALEMDCSETKSRDPYVKVTIDSAATIAVADCSQIVYDEIIVPPSYKHFNDDQVTLKIHPSNNQLKWAVGVVNIIDDY